MHKNDFFSLYIFFISVVFTQLPRTPNHFPLPRLWTLDRDFGPTTPDSRLLVKLSAASWNLFTLTAEADSFVSTCDVFNCIILLDVQNDIQLLSRVFCYSWLVCLLGFWLRNTSLVKVGNPISDGIVFVFHLAWCSLKFIRLLWVVFSSQQHVTEGVITARSNRMKFRLCLMRKSVEKSEAILALFDSFQELHLECQ